MKRILSILICLSIFFTYAFTYAPAGLADEPTPLPQTPEAYAASDYAKYAAKMAVGKYHMAAVKADGTVAVWGANNDNDTHDQLNVPDGLSGVKAVAAGQFCTLALKDDGSVTGWGTGYYNGTSTTEAPYIDTIPAELKQPGAVKSIAAGGSMSAAVKADGTVVTWGLYSASPNLATVLAELADVATANVVSVAINSYGAVALKQDGTIRVWGHADCITGFPETADVVAVAAGTQHWLALKKDGTVAIWGTTTHVNQCKNGTYNILSQENVRAIGAGRQLAVVLLADGTIRGCSTGNGLPANINNGDIVNVKALSVGAISQANGKASNVCVLKGDGSLSALGPNDYGQLDFPAGLNLLPASSNANLSGLAVDSYALTPAFDAAVTTYSVSVPNAVYSVEITATVADAGAFLKIGGADAASGVAQTVDDLDVGDNPVDITVTAADGTAKSYTLTVKRGSPASNNTDLSGLAVAGYALAPEFDAAVTAYSVSVPNAVYGVEITATTADAGATLKINGADAASSVAQAVYGLAEGDNAIEITVTAGDGTAKTYTLHVTRAAGGPGGLPQTPEVYAASDYARYGARMAGDNNFAAAVLQDGTVVAWGEDNTYGQLAVPAGATGVRALAAGDSHVLALKVDGSVVGWGLNSEGQCSLPAALAGKSIKAIAADGKNSAALSVDNTLVVWGTNLDGGKTLDLNGQAAAAVALNGQYVLALGDDGAVTAWDRYDDYRQCETPVGFSGNVVAIAAGSNDQVVALKADGTVVCWNDSSPVPATLSDVRAIAAGDNFGAALAADGTVTVWQSRSSFMASPPEPGRALALAGGMNNLFILQEDGALVVWNRSTGIRGDVPAGLNLCSAVSSNANLCGLTVSNGAGEAYGLSPVFNCAQTEYVTDVAGAEILVTAQLVSGTAALEINGTPATAGVAAAVYGLAEGDNTVTVKVTAESDAQKTYTLHVRRVSGQFTLPQTPAAYRESETAAYARRLAAGQSHSLALKKDGTVVAWGSNTKGQCNVLYNLHATALAAGQDHSLALKADGTVAAWGDNTSHQCDVPAGLSGVVDIAAGGSFSAALKQDGRITVWGDNSSGQLNVPAGLSEGGGVAAVRCGLAHVLTLKADGTVVAWGDDSYGQCAVPAGLSNVVAIAAGTRQSMALKANGELVVWGQNGLGQDVGQTSLQFFTAIGAGVSLGAAVKWDGSLAGWGTYTTSTGSLASMPFAVPPALGRVLAFSGSWDHLLVLCADGTVAALGCNYKGQCAEEPAGLNLFADDVPYAGPAIGIPQTPEAYAAGDYAQAVARIVKSDQEPVVLNMDGTVKAYDSSYQNSPLVNVPAGLNNVKAIATRGSSNAIALKEDGTVLIWGYNDDNQCAVPDGVRDVIAIAASQYCFLALKADGTVAAWGDNRYGQCDVPPNLGGVAAIAAGSNHCLALKADGTVVAWGDNSYGQCNVPAGLSDVARIYAKDNLSIALKADGTVAAWGDNRYGQCDVPAGLNDVVDISCYDNNPRPTCAALKGNGTVVVWGDNNHGARYVPADLHDVASVTVDASGQIYAVKKDGAVVSWGASPSVISGLANRLAGLEVIALTPGANYAVCRGGTVKCIKATNSAELNAINAMLAGVNVLAGHYFAVNSVELLDPAGQSVTSVPAQGGCRVQANIGNNYCALKSGLVIIQVRGGAGATSGGGGRVLGCVGLESEIPVVEGSAVGADFTMPAGVSGPAYVDVFIWDDWNTMVPRAGVSQSLSFTINEQ
ncbi:cadherin-like beta sandwich domain-containing protein [Pelotomaculum terephthalicicum JT]|uniref:cadherin-like beta sandwich domain-containing protein n=1 Tax=Pelotomaculum terephthalicicum TaxID=206393 RepID=UPI001F03998B|nr:cadherin-like beta sandwich domain-containing protein [Pelotomaculum terephthalicicum]MCG9967266.1 cadherin-like beta sandwich domain-containing protein [Pelotomaculum terephthalicicum JT]